MLFDDPHIQDAFDHDGYALINDFFNRDELIELRLLLKNFEQHTEAMIAGTEGTINSVERGIFFTRHYQDLDLEETVRARS